jgi:hypothetical protein
MSTSGKKSGRSPKRSARTPQRGDPPTLCKSCRQLVDDIRTKRELELNEFITELGAQNEAQQARLQKLEEQLHLHKDFQAQVIEKQREVQDLQKKNQKLVLLLQDQKKQTDMATKALYQSGRDGSPVPAQQEVAVKTRKETEAKMQIQIAKLREQHAVEMTARGQAEAQLQVQMDELREQHAAQIRRREEELHDEHEERRKEAVAVATSTQVTLKDERDCAQRHAKLLEQKLQDSKLEQQQQERQREMELLAGQSETQSALQTEAALAVELGQQVEELEQQLQIARLTQEEAQVAARNAEQSVLMAAEHLQAAQTVSRGTSPRSPLGTPEAIPPQRLSRTPPSGGLSPDRSPRSHIAGSSLEERADAVAEEFAQKKTERLQEVHAKEIETLQMQLKLHAEEHSKLVHLAASSPLKEGSPLFKYVHVTNQVYSVKSHEADDEVVYAAVDAQAKGREVKSPDSLILSAGRLDSDTEYVVQRAEATRPLSPDVTVGGNGGAADESPRSEEDKRAARRALFGDTSIDAVDPELETYLQSPLSPRHLRSAPGTERHAMRATEVQKRTPEGKEKSPNTPERPSPTSSTVSSQAGTRRATQTVPEPELEQASELEPELELDPDPESQPPQVLEHPEPEQSTQILPQALQPAWTYADQPALRLTPKPGKNSQAESEMDEFVNQVVNTPPRGHVDHSRDTPCELSYTSSLKAVLKSNADARARSLSNQLRPEQASEPSPEPSPEPESQQPQVLEHPEPEQSTLGEPGKPVPPPRHVSPAPELAPEPGAAGKNPTPPGSVASDTPDEQFGPESQRSRFNSDQLAKAMALAESGDFDTNGLVPLGPGGEDMLGSDLTSGLQPHSSFATASQEIVRSDKRVSTSPVAQSARSGDDDATIEQLLDDDRRAPPSKSVPPRVPARKGVRKTGGKSKSPRSSASSGTLPADVVDFLDANELQNYHGLFAQCSTVMHVYRMKTVAAVKTTAKKTPGFETMTAEQHTQVAAAIQAGIQKKRET